MNMYFSCAKVVDPNISPLGIKLIKSRFIEKFKTEVFYAIGYYDSFVSYATSGRVNMVVDYATTKYIFVRKIKFREIPTINSFVQTEIAQYVSFNSNWFDPSLSYLVIPLDGLDEFLIVSYEVN